MTYPGIENDLALLAGNPDMAAVEERRKEREAEYGRWVAVAPIPWGTVLAAIPGDRIPCSTVDRLHWDQLGLVAERDSEQGRKVLLATGGATQEERDRWESEKPAAGPSGPQEAVKVSEAPPAKPARKAAGGSAAGGSGTTNESSTATGSGE